MISPVAETLDVQAIVAEALRMPSSTPADPKAAADMGEKPSIYSTLTFKFCAASDFIFTLVEDGNSAS